MCVGRASIGETDWDYPDHKEWATLAGETALSRQSSGGRYLKTLRRGAITTLSEAGPTQLGKVVGLTLVRKRALFLGTLRLDHLPQVLPTSLWPAPPTCTTRRWGRGTSHDTNLLCPSLILRPGRARTPALFGLRSGPSWNEGFQSCWARLRLPKLLNHCLDGGTEKLWRPDWGIENKALLFLPDICQVHPQMSLRYHHGCHIPAHSSGSLLSGTEG